MMRALYKVLLMVWVGIGCAHVPTAVDIVQRQVEAYNAHDLDAFAGTYADDVLITSGAGQVLVLGKEGLRERYGKAFAKHPKAQCRVAERKTEGEGIVVQHELIDDRDLGWVRYEVRDGKIKSVQLE
ncbi:MAG: nuclear transport factor 2 family protein [Myxococcales bacterium]